MKLFRSALAGLAAVFCLSAVAEESAVTAPSPGISTAQENTMYRRLRSRAFSDFATTYHGPTVQKFGRYSQNALGDVDATALTGFESWFNVAYMSDLERGIGFGPDIWFTYQPNREGKQFDLQDVGLQGFYKNTIVTDHFHLYTNAFIQAPTSEYAREHGMAFALRTTPWVMYNIGQTRWRLGSWSDFRYLAGVARDMDVKAYIQPYVAYRLSDKLMINVAWETEAHHDVGDGALVYHNIISDFQPGLVWQVTPRTKIGGYVLLFPSNRVSTDTTGVGATLYSQLL